MKTKKTKELTQAIIFEVFYVSIFVLYFIK